MTSYNLDMNDLGFGNGDGIFIEGYNALRSKKFLVDPLTQKIKVEEMFKRGGSKDNFAYFGMVHCYGDREIIAPDVYRTSDPTTIIKIVDNYLIVEEKTSTWKVNEAENQRKMDYQLSLGVYYDGNTNKLPDKVLYKNKNYSRELDYGDIRGIEKFSIELNVELSQEVKDKIILGTTKVIQHSSGGTYNYCCGSFDVSDQWTTKTGEVSGFSEFGTDSHAKFRPQTDSFKVLILAKFGGGLEDPILLVKNIIILNK